MSRSGGGYIVGQDGIKTKYRNASPEEEGVEFEVLPQQQIVVAEKDADDDTEEED